MRRIVILLSLICSVSALMGYFIGRYATPYNTLNPILKEQKSSDLIAENIPESLLLALAKEFNIEHPGDDIDGLREDLSAYLASIKSEFQVSFNGHPLEGGVGDRVYNIAFHNDVRDWYAGTPGFNPREFNKPVNIGIFAPDGVVIDGVAGAVSLDALRSEPVNIHGGGIYYSPNNVKFQVQAGRAVSSFWSCAMSPDKQNLIVTFDVIIDDPDLESAVSDIMRGDSSLQDKMSLIIESASGMGLEPEDFHVLTEAVLLANS